MPECLKNEGFFEHRSRTETKLRLNLEKKRPTCRAANLIVKNLAAFARRNAGFELSKFRQGEK